MAEKGAHLTQITQIKPSIFDFVAQETLNDLLHPAAKRIFDVFCSRDASRQSLSKWFDEIFLASHFLLQLHYLKKYGGTFAESFYGLQRVPIKCLDSSKSLPRKELILSLIVVTVFPYIRIKLNKAAEQFYFEDDFPVTRKHRNLLKKSVITANSTIEISLRVINFVQHLRYLSGKSDVSAPLLWAAGVKLQYADDVDTNEPFSLRNFIPQFLRKSLEISAFFLQFYQWWQAENVGSLATLPVPPPPEITETGHRFGGLCPICNKKRKIETALSVSGFVFCFKCIRDHLEQNQHCPVTKIPATYQNLIRIYPPEE